VSPGAVANIGPRGRRRRYLSGLAWIGAGTLLVAGLALGDVHRALRLLVLPMFWSGALGVLQSREKT
jgi:hypothetical protein